MTNNTAIIEAAARALFAAEMPGSDWEVFPGLHDKFRACARAVLAAARAVQRKSDYVLSNETAERIATAVLAAVTPIIRAAALEAAALRIEAYEEDYLMRNEIAAAIRALKASAEDST